MRLIVIILSIIVTIGTFLFYMLGLMNLEPLSISSLLFFLSLVVTIRLIFQRKKHPN